MSAALRWRLAAASIAWRDLDGDIVVYHDGSGDTHHLGPLASATIRALAQHAGGLEFEALAQALHNQHVVAGQEVPTGELERTLAELANLKLAIAPAR